MSCFLVLCSKTDQCEGPVRSPDLQAGASFDVSVAHPSDFVEPQSLRITRLSDELSPSIRDSERSVATSLPLCDERMLFVSFLCNLTGSVGTRKSGTQECEEDILDAHAATLPLILPRHGPDQATNCFIRNDQDSEGLKVMTIAQSFPRHGPDQGTTCLVGTDQDSSGLRTSALALPFPKHGPDIAFAASFYLSVPLQFAIVRNCFGVPLVAQTTVVRMANGREAYGRLRPVRRPWF